MNIINITVEFEEREVVKEPLVTGWGNYEDYLWYGIMKMNGIPIFETRVNYYDEHAALQDVIESFARSIRPEVETILR